MTRNNSPAWLAGVLLILIPVALPIGVLLYALFVPPVLSDQSPNIWAHIRTTVLPSYLYNTFTLMVSVGLTTIFIGVSTAWLSAKYTFPMSKILAPALILPLAAPAYVVGYVYADLLEFSGPIQEYIRVAFDLKRGVVGEAHHVRPDVGHQGLLEYSNDLFRPFR